MESSGYNNPNQNPYTDKTSKEDSKKALREAELKLLSEALNNLSPENADFLNKLSGGLVFKENMMWPETPKFIDVALSFIPSDSNNKTSDPNNKSLGLADKILIPAFVEVVTLLKEVSSRKKEGQQSKLAILETKLLEIAVTSRRDVTGSHDARKDVIRYLGELLKELPDETLRAHFGWMTLEQQSNEIATLERAGVDVEKFVQCVNEGIPVTGTNITFAGKFSQSTALPSKDSQGPSM